MFVTQQTKTTSHTIMRCHSGTAIDFSWQLQMPGVFCLSRFDSLLLGDTGYFSVPFPGIRVIYDLSWFMIFGCLYFASLIIKGLWTLPGHTCFPNVEMQVFPSLLEVLGTRWYSRSLDELIPPCFFDLLLVGQLYLIQFCLNSCSEMQWEARVHKCRRTWNLNEFKLANSFPITIMTLNGVQFQGQGGTHHPAVLSTWIHVKQLHTRTSIRASMSMAPL